MNYLRIAQFLMLNGRYPLAIKYARKIPIYRISVNAELLIIEHEHLNANRADMGPSSMSPRVNCPSSVETIKH